MEIPSKMLAILPACPVRSVAIGSLAAFRGLGLWDAQLRGTTGAYWLASSTVSTDNSLNPGLASGTTPKILTQSTSSQAQVTEGLVKEH
jgi:hypothetical protein